MCDIKEKTQLKTMTVYKAVYKKDNGEYLSAFAKAPIKIGEVPFFKMGTLSPGYNTPYHVMYGHISGCARKKDAFIISKLHCFNYCNQNMQVLKIKLGGSILIGTTKNICDELQGNHITYAGSEILSIEEI